MASWWYIALSVSGWVGLTLYMIMLVFKRTAAARAAISEETKVSARYIHAGLALPHAKSEMVFLFFSPVRKTKRSVFFFLEGCWWHVHGMTWLHAPYCTTRAYVTPASCKRGLRACADTCSPPKQQPSFLFLPLLHHFFFLLLRTKGNKRKMQEQREDRRILPPVRSASCTLPFQPVCTRIAAPFLPTACC